jgi:hypothetical protein
MYRPFSPEAPLGDAFVDYYYEVRDRVGASPAR